MQYISLLKNKLGRGDILIIDGAMGSEIKRRGISTQLPLWSAEALLKKPGIVKQIHKDYIIAGADIITTNTFNTTKRVFEKKNIGSKSKWATITACQLAKDARDETKTTKKIFIAGSVSPLEDCYSPELTPSDAELEAEHYELAKNLKEGGVDFLLLETMITIRESVAAIKAAQKVSLPFAICFCCNNRGQLLSGESLKEAIDIASQYNPLFIGINCVEPEIVTKNIEILKKSEIPFAVYAQSEGEVNDESGWSFEENQIKNPYVQYVEEWVKDKTQIIGGCCGTNPGDIQKIQRLVNKRNS